jgi:cytochrome P450
MPISAQAGGEPRCLMDFWAQRCLEEVAEAAQNGVPPPGHASDHAMADTVMDFLFASQDASTASLVWTMCLMADHPDILQKVRAAGDSACTRVSVGKFGTVEQVGMPSPCPTPA